MNRYKHSNTSCIHNLSKKTHIILQKNTCEHKILHSKHTLVDVHAHTHIHGRCCCTLTQTYQMLTITKTLARRTEEYLDTFLQQWSHVHVSPDKMTVYLDTIKCSVNHKFEMTVYLDAGLGFDQLGHGAVVGAVHVLYHPEQRLLPRHPVVYPRLLLLHICDRFCDDCIKQLSLYCNSLI